jgi:hypothetical protein
MFLLGSHVKLMILEYFVNVVCTERHNIWVCLTLLKVPNMALPFKY